MNIDQLREFTLLAKTMNFTRAAQMLNLSQSALSTHVMKMERELGVRLLDRSHQKIGFTPAGRELLETTSVMLEAYDKYLDRCRARKNRLSTHFTVLSLQHVDTATFVLLRRIQRFREEHPEALIDVRESLDYNTSELIGKGVVECGYFGIHLKEPETDEGIEAVPLMREEFVAWVDKGSRFAKAAGLQPADLQGVTVPIWAGLSNDLETVCREFFSYFEVDVHFSDRYCTSREDYFLSRVRSDDVVLLTRGSENINAVKARDDRVSLRFDPPVFATSYVAFDEGSADEGLLAFKEFIRAHSDEVGADLA